MLNGVKKDIQKELLDNAKFAALDDVRLYSSKYTVSYAGNSLQKAKSYEAQGKAAENILIAEEAKQQLNSKDVEIIEPLAKVRGISVTEMAKLIQSKAQKAVEAIVKCEELEDISKKRIGEAKTQEELQSFLNKFEQEMQKVLTD